MIDYLLNYLNSLYPNAKCSLNYQKDYELLISIMLSAQTSDNAVNKVTKVLFEKYQSLDSLANAKVEDISSIIRYIGLYKRKSINIINISKQLIEKYQMKVPLEGKILETLPGVGHKTANCFLAIYYDYPLFAIDTHVQRIAKRLNLVKDNDDPKTIEKKLMKIISSDRVVLFNHQLISFGRNICLAKNPKCNECQLRQYCKYSKP